MQQKMITLFLILFFVLNLNCFNKKNSNPQSLGIIKASKLACRKEPSINSEVIKYYSFGTPVKLINKTMNQDSVNNINNYWYQDEATKGWIFGEYLLLTEFNESRIFHFKLESIRCNVVCGGLSCFNQFHPYLIGDLYIATYYLNDYPEKNSPEFGIIVGNYKINKDFIEFDNAKIIAGYDSNANYIKDLLSKDFENKEQLLKNFNRKYMMTKDEEGIYYRHPDDNNSGSRKDLREKCGNKSLTDEIWYDSYELKSMTLKELQDIFPLIEIKNNNYMVK